MNILITASCNGNGEYIASYFGNKHNITLITEDDFNIEDEIAMNKIITSKSPNIVLHALEFSDIEGCEKEENKAYFINTILTMNIAKTCKNLDIPIIYISTSYVFDGYKSKPYSESDTCNPLNIYGKTKMGGEQLIRTLCNKYFILRCSWIFGSKECFVRKVLDNNAVPIFLASNELGNPTYIEDLCNVIDSIMESDKFGIYNCASPNPITKSEFVGKIFGEINLEKEIVAIPCNYLDTAAKRPEISALTTDGLFRTFGIKLPKWETSLNKYIKEIW